MGSFLRQMLQGLERRPAFSDLQRGLSLQATSFIDLCDSREPRMREIVAELQETSAHVRDGQKTLACAGVFSAAAIAAVAYLAARFAAGLSIALVAAVALVGIIVVFNLFLKQRRTDDQEAEKMNRLMEEFRMIVVPLRSCLERVKSACGNLHRGSVGAETLQFIRLEINILELFFLTAKLRTSTSVSCITETTDEYKKAADEFVKMKSNLRTFYIQERAEDSLLDEFMSGVEFS